MQITMDRQGPLLTIRLDGELDESGAAAVKAAFEDLSLDGLGQIELDFRNVDWIGSSGLGKLIMLYKRMAASGGEVAIINANATVTELLREVNLHNLFKV